MIHLIVCVFALFVLFSVRISNSRHVRRERVLQEHRRRRNDERIKKAALRG